MGFIVKVMGLIDLVATAMLFLASTDWVPAKWILYVAAALAVKGIAFMKDPVSKFDIIIALYLALTIVFNIKLLSILLGVYLCFKALYSFI